MADFSTHAAEIARDTGVKSSATKLINTFQSRLDAGIAAAIKANDDADLTELQKLSSDLKVGTDELAAAVEANTQASTEPPAEGGAPA